MKKKSIKIPLYGGKLIIYQTNNFKKIGKKYKYDLSGCEACVFQINKSNGAGMFYMVFEETTTPRIIAHEAVHVTNRIFRQSGVELDIENDESYAYMLDWVVNKCHKFLDVKNGK